MHQGYFQKRLPGAEIGALLATMKKQRVPIDPIMMQTDNRSLARKHSVAGGVL